MRRSLVAAVMTVVISSGCGSDAPDPVPATGYALEGSATASDITRDGDYLQTIGVDGITLASPNSITEVSGDATALREAAQSHDRDAILLVSNYSNDISDFDEKLAFQMLSSPDNRAAVVAALVAEASEYDGLQLDLESLKKRDLEGLAALAAEVRAALPKSKQLSMALMASTDEKGYVARGYDLESLGKSLDRLVLMAYDQHGPGWSGPGPIGSLPWVRRELTYFASRVPKSKVDLGVAAYAYQWKASPGELTVAQARKAAGSKARWSSKHGEWHANLPGGRTIWWSDKRSLSAREEMAREFDVHGVAIWEIGASGRLR